MFVVYDSDIGIDCFDEYKCDNIVLFIVFGGDVN